jgi:PKD repeat protein
MRRTVPAAAAIALVVGLVVPVLAGTAPAEAATASVPRPDHVVIVIDENHSEQSVLGNPNAPYINSLAAAGANLTGFHAETHPSQPNYLALFSGSTQGVTDDSCPHTFAADNLGAELIAAGLGFTGYSEGLPSVGFTGCSSGEYARKHNPWSDFSNVPASSSQPFTAFPSDYSTLPPVSFVIPNLDNDMHDGTIAQGDSWLQSNLSGYISWAQTHNSVFVLTFDEDDGSQQNQIPTIITGAGVVAGSYPETVNHYNLLRTIEDAYGLTPVGASATANPITDIWAGGTGNQPPAALFGWSCAQLSCSFDGTASRDPDGSISQYQWNFGDGGSATGATASHTFAAGASYPVTLTVTDNLGATGSVTHTVTASTAGTPFVSDTFNRTVTNGLGTADAGGVWSIVGTSTNFRVAPGAADLALPKGGNQDEGYVGPVQTDADVTATVSTDRVPVGGPLYLSVTGRRLGSGTRYAAQVLCNPSGTVSIAVQRVLNGAGTALASKTVAGLACAAGSPLRIRLQVTGTNPTALNAKVWAASATEPSVWQVTATDSTAAFQVPGTVGAIAYLSSGASNAPVNVALTSFAASSTAPTQNQPPTAAFTSSCTQLTCTFNGSGSSDADGTITSYAWDFGDGATGSGVNPTHAFVASGTYPVTLTVTDNQGASSSIGHSVTVTAAPPNQPPTAVFTTSCTQLTCAFDGSLSSDPDGTITSYAWDFGDGGTGTGATPSHTYTTAGTYPVTLTVTDDDDATGSVSHQVAPTSQQSTLFASDDFGRTASNGWGTADLGGAWSLVGTPSRASVSGGAGQLNLGKSNQMEMYLGGVSVSDSDVLVGVTPSLVPVGGQIYVSVLARRTATTTGYTARALLNPDGSVTLSVNRVLSNATTVLATTKLTGLSYSAGTTVDVRVEASGTSPTTVRARAWLASTTEPSTWQLTATDSTAALQTPGSVGVIGYLSGGATNGPVVLGFTGFRGQPPTGP